MTLIELIATLFGVACVWLYIRQNVWSWPTGLIQVILYTWIFYQAKLYSDFLLHIVYIILSIYGWYHWTHGGREGDQKPVKRLTMLAWAAWLIVAAAATTALGFVMHRYTDASLPYWDAAIAILSLIAQYLLARKVLENWLFWIVVDILAIGVYLAKGLYITTGLYALFLGMATAGWFAWRASYRQTSPRTPIAGPAAASSSASSFLHTADTNS